MKFHRVWGLVLVAGLSACIGDNPTGVSHEGPNVVNNLRMYQLQGRLLADEELVCEIMDFEEFTGNMAYDPLAGTLLGENWTAEIKAGWVDYPMDCGSGTVVVFDTGIDGPEDHDLFLAGNSGGLTLGNVVAHQSCQTDGIPDNDPLHSDLVDPTFIQNDADAISTMKFTFPTGDWLIKQFAALDQETHNEIALFTDGVASNTTNGAVNFANSVEVVIVDANGSFNTMLEFVFDGTGAIDELEICRMEVDRGGEGCTPGYWKQSQHFDSWPSGDTSIRFDAAFVDACVWDAALQRPESGMLCDLTLLQALNLKGGGANALGRHAAAAWLNTQSVDFMYLQSEVEDMVDAALESGIYEITKDGLADANEAGCPLN